jgi:hypothetical protein
MNIATEWAKLPAFVRAALPDNLPAAFASALAQLKALGLAVDADRSIAALLTAANVETTAARIEGRTVSRSESDWMRMPLFVVGRDAPADFLRLRQIRHAEIRNAQPLVAYKIAEMERTGGGMEAHQADADLGAAVDNALSAQPATQPEAPATLAARIAPVVFAQLGFTPPPPPRRKRPLPKQIKPDPKPPAPEQPAPEQPATSAGLPAWVLPAAAVAVVGVLVLRLRR